MQKPLIERILKWNSSKTEGIAPDARNQAHAQKKKFSTTSTQPRADAQNGKTKRDRLTVATQRRWNTNGCYSKNIMTCTRFGLS